MLASSYKGGASRRACGGTLASAAAGLLALPRRRRLEAGSAPAPAAPAAACARKCAGDGASRQAATLTSTLAAALGRLSLLLQDTRELWLYRGGPRGKHAAGKHAASKHGTLERLCASSSSSADRRCSQMWQFTPHIEHADADHI